MYQGLYARVLVDVDVSKRLPEKALASLNTEKKDLNIRFFVNFLFEKLPNFCDSCKILGHSVANCIKHIRDMQDGGVRRNVRLAIEKHIRMLDRGTEQTAMQVHDEERSGHSSDQHINHGTKGTGNQDTGRGPLHSNQQVNIEQHQTIKEKSTPLAAVQTIRSAKPGSLQNLGQQSRFSQTPTSNRLSALNETDQHVGSNQRQTIGHSSREDQNDKVQRLSPAKDRWDTIASALKDIESTRDELASINPDFQYGNIDLDKISPLFSDDFEVVTKVRMHREQVRKNEEWERNKQRLEQRMAVDMEQRRAVRESSQQSKGNSSSSRKWDDLEETEEDQDNQEVASSTSTRSIVLETQMEKPTLDPDKIYWDENSEIFVHASGMCFDPNPGAKSYYTLMDQEGGDLRPLYYVQSGGDFKLAENGKFGQCDKIVLDDKSWDRKAVYNVKSTKYKPGLLKMFKEKMKEGSK